MDMDNDSSQVFGGRRDLLLMRHAKSSWGQPGLRDFERVLSPRGHKAAARMGRWLAKTDRVPDHVICSPARRARETVSGVLEALGCALQDVRWAERIYAASPSDLIGVLSEAPDTARRVLMIGHNPGFEILTALLAGHSASPSTSIASFSTASVAHFSFEGHWKAVPQGDCELVTLVRPKELAPDS